MSHLKNSVAIITGGSSGIGFAIASALLAEGIAGPSGREKDQKKMPTLIHSG